MRLTGAAGLASVEPTLEVLENVERRQEGVGDRRQEDPEESEDPLVVRHPGAEQLPHAKWHRAQGGESEQGVDDRSLHRVRSPITETHVEPESKHAPARDDDQHREFARHASSQARPAGRDTAWEVRLD